MRDQHLAEAEKPALPRPACYRPYATGRFEVKAGLRKLGADFGNGDRDKQAFQIDEYWPAYRKAKLTARAERLQKFVIEREISAETRPALIQLIIARLLAEHPQFFREYPSKSGGIVLNCGITGETLSFDRRFQLRHVKKVEAADPPYYSALDALACQIQEDLAVVEVRDGGKNQLTGLHLCFPNHWAAEQKIGLDFAAIHEPVPGTEKINRNAPALLETITRQRPFVRFAWGLATDKRLNHHPEPPPDIEPAAWRGRRFDPSNPNLYVRIERQTTIPIPELSTFVFIIRTYFEDVSALSFKKRLQLAAAIKSMDPETRIYKGIAGQEVSIIDWLEI